MNLALESGIAGKKWKQISVYLSQMMNNGEIIEFLRRYNVSTDDFIMCLTHHSNQLPSVLVELERVVNSGGQQEEELVLNLEALRQRMDHVASFKGLRQFYVQYTKKQAKQTHWGSLREFLEYMESSDMTLKKLTNLQEKGKLESFFRSIKTDLADFIKLKELFQNQQ